MGVYDQAARWAVEIEPHATIQRLLHDTGLALRFSDWVDSRTTPPPGEEDRTADRVAALIDDRWPDGPWLLLAEFQAQHDPEKLDVTLQEAARLRVQVRHGHDRADKYRVLTAIIYLCGRCPITSLHMTAPSGHGSRHAPVVWEVEADDARRTLDDLESGKTTWGILFWIPLMHGAADAVIIARWRELALALAPKPAHPALGRVALLFADLARRFLAWEKGLEGWNVKTESPYMNRLLDERELRRAQADLVRFLTFRFPGAVTDDVVEAVNMQPSLPLLNDWMDQALSVKSIDEFVAFLRR